MIREVISLLDVRSRGQYAVLLGLSVVASLLQTVGIAGLSVFFAILLGGEPPAVVSRVIKDLPLANVSGMVLVILAAGTMCSAFTTYLGISLAWSQYQQIATRALNRFIHCDFEWHLQQNSTNLIRTIISETQTVVIGVYQQLVLIAVRINEFLFIGLLLLISKPLVAMTALATFGSLYGMLYLVNLRTIGRLGEDVSAANSERQLAVTEALTGLKIVKVFGIEAYFLQRFSAAARKLSLAQGLIQYYSLLPKYFIELLLFSGLLGFITVSQSRGWSTAESIPLLALYGAAAVRLLPAAQQIYASFSVLTSSRAALENVWWACNLPNQRSLTGLIIPDSNELLRFSNVEYIYPSAPVPALHGLDFSISHGEKVGVVGSTGAGKTTTVDLLLGLLAPTSGQILRGAPRSGQNSVSYVPQQLHFLDDSVAANIAIGVPADEIDWPRLHQAARTAKVHDVIMSLPQGYMTPLGEQGARLSGGQCQRLGIARALYQRPAILVLDEASNALDAETERQVVETLLQLQTELTVIIIAHRISILRGCDRILVMEKGRIQAEGSFEKLLSTNELFQRLAQADSGVPA